MKSAYDIIIRPINTERSMERASMKKYVFEIAPDANKIEVRNAVEEIFDVKVKSVNTIKLPAKSKRVGVHLGKTTATKKAVVTLTPDSKGIEIFEGMV